MSRREAEEDQLIFSFSSQKFWLPENSPFMRGADQHDRRASTCLNGGSLNFNLKFSSRLKAKRPIVNIQFIFKFKVVFLKIFKYPLVIELIRIKVGNRMGKVVTSSSKT